MNKKILSFVFAISMLSTLFVSAGGGYEKKNIIKWNVAELAIPVIHTFTLSYERALQDNLSINFNVCFFNASLDLNAASNNAGATSNSSVSASQTTFGVTPELRFYPGDEAPHGFYVGPYITYKNFNFSADGKNSNGETASGSLNFTAFGGGGMIGYQFIIGSVFVIDINTGFGYYNIKSGDLVLNYNSGSQSYPTGIKVAGTTPIFGFSLGGAF